jgi:hypothetical protein
MSANQSKQTAREAPFWDLGRWESSDVNAWIYAAFGTAFGWTLSRSGAADYDFVQAMFLFTNFQL